MAEQSKLLHVPDLGKLYREKKFEFPQSAEESINSGYGFTGKSCPYCGQRTVLKAANRIEAFFLCAWCDGSDYVGPRDQYPDHIELANPLAA